MAVTLITTPAHEDTSVYPAFISRWLATESPNNFRLLRKDFVVSNQASTGGGTPTTVLTLAAPYTGQVGNSIVIHSAHNDGVYTGLVTDVASPATAITVNVPWLAAYDIDYLNDNTLRGGYYFEGRLTVNGVVQALTVIASPDSKGYADLDVSGVLRIMVALGKTADYTVALAAEPTKGGEFTFEYRECWYGSAEAYTAEGNTWYYVEAVRSVEQGSNLYEYVASEVGDAPFLNAFEQPVYFVGLPFDISFLVPVQPDVSPAVLLQVIIKRYNASNTLLGTTTTLVSHTGLDGKVCSLLIDPAIIEASAAYLTAEINAV